MLEYYMPPFVGETDRQVMASLAQTVNNPGNMNAIAQTPHHFELHQLADVDEDTGKITPKHEYICDCSTLVRPSVRGAGATGGAESKTPIGRSSSPSAGLSANTSANPRAPANPPQADPGALQAPPARPGGIHPGNN